MGKISDQQKLMIELLLLDKSIGYEEIQKKMPHLQQALALADQGDFSKLRRFHPNPKRKDDDNSLLLWGDDADLASPGTTATLARSVALPLSLTRLNASLLQASGSSSARSPRSLACPAPSASSWRARSRLPTSRCCYATVLRRPIGFNR